MAAPYIARVAVDIAVYQADKLYDYFIPSELSSKAVPGCRVTVPFGRGNKRMQGIIIERVSDDINKNAKPILSVEDDKPILTPEMIDLARWMKANVFCLWFDAVRAMVPYGIAYRVVESYALNPDISNDVLSSLNGDELRAAELFSCGVALKSTKVLKTLGLTDESDILTRLCKKGVLHRCDLTVRNMNDPTIKMVKPSTDEPADLSKIKLTPKQRQAYNTLCDIGTCSIKELCYFSGVTKAVITALNKKGLTTEYECETSLTRNEDVEIDNNTIILTAEQQAAFDELSEKLSDEKGSAALLYGVTGSGKTQVFLKLCEAVLEQERTVIVMVPEISLTPQMLKKFKSRFGDNVAVFHSAMSQGQRMDEWKRVKRGEAKVVLGTRSAVFAPLKNIGIIIIDEEQEHTYKSEMSPRFHARDIARFRAVKNNSLLVLASATPSIESFTAAKNGRYSLCRLTERYGNAVLPDVVTVDMREEQSKGNTGSISNRLYDEISNALSSNKQAIILLNRRGHNTYVSCPSCGYVLTCPNCSISMTYHSANNRLMCHYCGHSVEYTSQCPNCGSKHIKYSGQGTQKVQQELELLFPDAKILRMDADTTMARNSYDKGLGDFAAGKYDIMIGTQMVAKGLDFPNVTLVGVIGADQSLYSDDFRSFERTFSLLTQVVGRSGRGNEKGLAVIQTFDPDNNIIKLAAAQDYEQFYDSEILTRKLMVYPPYCDLMVIGVSSTDSARAVNAANELLSSIKSKVSTDNSNLKIIALGPTASAVPKVNNKYRYKIILKYINCKEFREMIDSVLIDFYNSPKSKQVSVFIDPNPDTII